MACSSCVLKTISCLVKQPNQRSHPTSSLTSSTLLSFKLSNPSLTQTIKLHSTSPQSTIFSLPKRSFACKSQADSSDSARPSKYFSHLLTQPPLFALQNYTFWLDPIWPFGFPFCLFIYLLLFDIITYILKKIVTRFLIVPMYKIQMNGRLSLIFSIGYTQCEFSS